MGNLIHILHLEDDPFDAELVQNQLAKHNLNYRITLVQTRDKFEHILRSGNLNIILADFRLPMYDGMSALRLTLEVCPDIPFIFVSGTMGEEAAVEALTQGATDYVLKQNLSRLASAIQRALQEARNRDERRKAQEALQRSNEMLRAIIEAAPTAIIGLDLDGNVHSVWNPAAVKMLGWSAQEVMGRLLPTISAENQNEFRKFQEQIRKGVILNGVDVRRQRRDGSRIDYSIYASPLHDAQGRVSGNIAVLVDITDRKQTEDERQAHLKFFENMEKVNRAIQGAVDLENMMEELLDVVSSIFDCDRAYLLCPCDPKSPTWTVPMECNKPEYPGVLDLKSEMVMDPQFAEKLRILLDADGSVVFGPDSSNELPEDVSKQFNIKSILAMAVFPKTGSPWEFGIHQCSHVRRWTVGEKRIFEAIGRRLEDALTSLLTYRHLQKSEERYRLIAENTVDTISIFDPDLKPTYISPSVQKLLGYTVQEALFRPMDQLLTPESLQKVKKVFDEQMTLEESGDADPSRSILIELEEYRKDGSTIWVELVASILRGENLQPTGILTVSRNITGRKKAEESIRKLSLAIEQSPVSIVITDVDGRIEFVNTKFTLITGYSLNEALGQNPRILKSGETSTDKYRRLWQTISSGRVWKGELHNRRKNGELFWEQATIAPVRGMDNRITHYVAVKEDITERKLAEEALQEKRDFIRNILDAVDEGFIVIDTQYQIRSANRAFCNMVDAIETDVVGQPCYKISHQAIRPCYETGEICPVRRTLTTGKPQFATHVHVNKYGVDSYIELKAYPITDDSGKVISVIETFNDVTENRKLQDQLIQSQKMESVGRLAGGVAHDFNNMLGVIMGYSEMALSQIGPSNPLYDNFNEIFKAAKRSGELTRQLLAFARRQVMAPKVLDLNETVEGMIKMLKRLIGEDIEVVWKPIKAKCSLKMDPAQIDQIMVNLCVNARDAIAGVGTIIIETGLRTFDQRDRATHPGCRPGEFILLSISDDGHGMDKATRKKIFEPFFTTKEIGKGTGLGLATVYGIIKQNNGFIYVYSEPQYGTSFRIYLPRHSENKKNQEDKIANSVISRGCETILLVEDNPAILGMTKKMLEKLGYRVLATTTPREAFRIAEKFENEIHLLLTDVVMPEMSGVDLAQQLLSFRPSIRHLFMSGYPDEFIAVRGVLEEGVNFIQKPFSTQDIATKVAEIISNNGPKTNNKANAI